MAASSGDDVPTQLAALLGREIARIRKTNQTPPKVSVIDVVQAITGKDARHAAEDVRSLCSSYPEVDRIFVHFRLCTSYAQYDGTRKRPALSQCNDVINQHNVIAMMCVVFAV